MKRTTAVCLLLFAAGSVRADEPAPVKVPFEILKSKHMAVMVKVNGKGPYRLIFDTGAPYNLLSRKVAGEAGLGKKKAGGLALPGLGLYKVKSLQVGDVKVEGTQAMVFDHPTVKLLAKHVGPLEGIVGFSFFAKFRVTIDYQKKELTFVPTKYRPPDVMARMMSMMFGGGSKAAVLAPAGVWGFTVSKKDEDSEPGVTVKGVLEGSPAAAAGLRAGDRLLTLQGRWTDSVADCYRAAGTVRPGTAATLRVQRNGKEMELTVTVKAGL
jgi:hypothetical protein